MPRIKGAYLFYNDQYLPIDDFKLSLENRAFLYGDGFFETIFCRGTSMPFLDYHYLRMEAAFKVFKFSAQSLPTKEQFAAQVKGLLTRNKYFAGARVRVVFCRKEGGLYTPLTNHAETLMVAKELPNDVYELNEKGLIVDISAEQQIHQNQFSVFKNIAAQPYIMAGIEKVAHNLDDVILVNDKGNLAESISSNLFIVQDGDLFTPGLNSGCVGGVVRQVILDQAAKLNIKIHQLNLNTDVLLKADEVFLTNAIQGVNWVGAFRTKRYYYRTAKKVIQMLNSLLVDNTH